MKISFPTWGLCLSLKIHLGAIFRYTTYFNKLFFVKLFFVLLFALANPLPVAPDLVFSNVDPAAKERKKKVPKTPRVVNYHSKRN